MLWLIRVSNALLKLEKCCLIGITALLTSLILFHIVGRAAVAFLFRADIFLGLARVLQRGLFPIDELAVYAMIWMALIGASAMVRMRAGVAVTLLTDALPVPARRAMSYVADGIILTLALALLALCWQWYDPVALARSGFDFELFAANTFKFIYSEPTNTVGIAKFWIWLAVPLTALTMSLHALANLLEGPDETAPGADRADNRSSSGLGV